MRRKSILHDKSGSALILAMVFSAIFLIVGTGTMQLISRGNQILTRDIELIKAYWANESVVRIGLSDIASNPAHPDWDVNTLHFSTINGYRPRIAIINSLINGIREYDVTVTTQVKNVTTTTNIGRVSFNSVAYYTYSHEKDWGPFPWDNVVINGNYHSNDTITVSETMPDVVHVTGKTSCASNYDGSARFPFPYNKGIDVWSADQDLEWFKNRFPDYHSSNPILTHKHSPKIMDSYFYDPYLRPEWDYPGVYTDYFIKPYIGVGGTGNVAIYGMNISGDSICAEHLGNKDLNTLFSDHAGLIYSRKPVHIAGTVKGALSVLSDENIYMAGHLLYDDVPQGSIPTNSSSNVCGIISDKDIIIQSNFYTYYKQDGASWTDLLQPSEKVNWNGPEDQLDIYASIIASHGEVDVGYTADNIADWGTNGMNKLKIYGSCSVNQQPFTYWGGTEKGFAISYNGDPRFMGNTMTPPWIPDVEHPDYEKREHWSKPAATKFPLTVESWSQTVTK